MTNEKNILNISISIESYGSWENHLSLCGEYETIVKEIDKFYEMTKISQENVIKMRKRE